MESKLVWRNLRSWPTGIRWGFKPETQCSSGFFSAPQNDLKMLCVSSAIWKLCLLFVPSLIFPSLNKLEFSLFPYENKDTYTFCVRVTKDPAKLMPCLWQQWIVNVLEGTFPQSYDVLLAAVQYLPEPKWCSFMVTACDGQIKGEKYLMIVCFLYWCAFLALWLSVAKCSMI